MDVRVQRIAGIRAPRIGAKTVRIATLMKSGHDKAIKASYPAVPWGGGGMGIPIEETSRLNRYPRVSPKAALITPRIIASIRTMLKMVPRWFPKAIIVPNSRVLSFNAKVMMFDAVKPKIVTMRAMTAVNNLSRKERH